MAGPREMPIQAVEGTQPIMARAETNPRLDVLMYLLEEAGLAVDDGWKEGCRFSFFVPPGIGFHCTVLSSLISAPVS